MKRNHFLPVFLTAFLAAGLAAFFWGLAAFLATFLGAAFLTALGLAWITFFAIVTVEVSKNFRVKKLPPYIPHHYYRLASRYN